VGVNIDKTLARSTLEEQRESEKDLFQCL